MNNSKMIAKICLNKKASKNKNLVRIQLNPKHKNSVNYSKITKMVLRNKKKRVSKAINQIIKEITNNKTMQSMNKCLLTSQIKVREIYQRKSKKNLTQKKFRPQNQKQSGPLSLKKSKKLERKSTIYTLSHKRKTINFLEKPKMMKTSLEAQRSE